MSNLDTVNQFLKVVVARDLDTACTLVTDDVEYDNVPISKSHGPAELRTTLESFFAMATDLEWIVHREAATGDIVMNERTDRFEVGGKWLEIPVCGVFELRDGRIALWRDYFDMGMFQSQLAGG